MKSTSLVSEPGSTGSPPTCASTSRVRRARAGGRPPHTFAEVPWLQPYPDRLLDELVATEQPDARGGVGGRPSSWPSSPPSRSCRPRQRAALVVPRCAGLAGGRDRGGPTGHQRRRGQQRVATGPGDHAAEHAAVPPPRLVGRCVPAPTSAPCSSASSTPTSGATPRRPWPSPPRTCVSPCRPARSVRRLGRRSAPLHGSTPSDRTGTGDWRLRAEVRANRMPDRGELPAAAGRHRVPGRSSSMCCASRTDVVAEITTFDAGLFGAFGLPAVLDDEP